MEWESADDLQEWEYPDEPDLDEDHFGDTDVIRCPHCRGDVYEDAEQCPACGEYLSPAAHRTLPPIWLCVAIALLIIIAAGLLSLLF